MRAAEAGGVMRSPWTTSSLLAGLFLVVLGLTSCAQTPSDVAVFHIPPEPSRFIPLSADVPVVSARLRSLGDTAATVSVDGDTLVVQGGGPLPAPAPFFVKTGNLSLRPVLCGAPADTSPAAARLSNRLPPCGAQYETSESNLAVNMNTGQPGTTILPDPIFATYSSTTADDADQPSETVLLPAIGEQQYSRFVLGPAQVANPMVANAQATFDNTINEWSVDATLTPLSAVQFDRAAQADFHRYMAFDMDGAVLMAPLMQPNEDVFTSFEGKMEISGTLTRNSARQLAALLASGPLLSPLVAR